jgi:hypothetical protein
MSVLPRGWETKFHAHAKQQEKLQYLVFNPYIFDSRRGKKGF